VGPDAVTLGRADPARTAGGANAACTVGGPWFEELEVGQVFADAPALTLTEGHAALHQAIVGDRLRVALDGALSRAVVGAERTLAHPALAWDVAIGQSTTATQRVIANLFYRGLTFRRAPLVGDTLRTRTEVVSLRHSTRRPEVPARGLARLALERLEPLAGGGGLAHLRARLQVVDETDQRRDALDWRFVAALA
jgi:acyl dehydratase